MIESATFKNFKCLREVSVRISPFTLIAGPNASGKTSILEALKHVLTVTTQLPEQVLSSDRQDPALLRSQGVKDRMVLSVTGLWNGLRAALSVTASDEDQDRKKWVLEFGSAVHLDGTRLVCEFDAEARGRLARQLPDALREPMLLRLDPARLAEPSFTENLRSSILPDGWGLAAVLADMAITEPVEFQSLQSTLRAIVPAVRAIRFEKAAVERVQYENVREDPEHFREVRTKYWGYQLVLDCASGSNIPGHLLSEGTLLTLGLLTAISREPRPRLLLVDGLERGLHPKALGELTRQMRALQQRFPELQIISTTHSPYLVDHFDPTEVILTTSQDDGAVAAGLLNEHPDFDRWKDEMKPGEFWSTVGEDWLKQKVKAGG